ncbi:nucleotide-binding universal stress UspA family protein [Pelomonas saccharophila]|uniref:Nucleotide-binding universal stress UspA family protein n=1 Tax=Roseateles saccharophilus TaxID=304 RepID=A0ABU1YN29_ROSSA|nr:universal stress protein [Roseateles saccharophilus]MDR7270262.1 nucleotide-binding universal stress UspA family protein [Roseateles saccharophilus]
MSLRSILVHLDSSRHAQARVDTAAALALQYDAHLIGLAPTGWMVMPAESVAAAALAMYEETALRLLREAAQARIDDFRQQVQRLGVPSYETRMAVGYAGEAMALAARYCDLTVVTQNDPDEVRAEQSPQMAQDVLLQSGRPLLVLPYAGEWTIAPPRRVLVGWNASREAARAMHDALPFLRKASNVQVAVFETPEDVGMAHGDVPGADIGLWLARHGVKVDVKHVPAKVAAGEALLSHAFDINADLIVTGGYGHSRFRESILGGVTRTLMRSSPVPVLMSH